LTFNARSGRHDDLLLAAAMAAWYFHAGRPNQGVYDYAALAGHVGGEKHVIAVDLGQSNDPTAICVMSRVKLPGRGDEAFEAVA
jgi:hypothetical protein